MWQLRVSKRNLAGAQQAHVARLGTDTVREFPQKEIFLFNCHTTSTTSTCLLLPALLNNSSLPWRPVLQQHTENCSCKCLQIAESMWSMHGNYSRRQQSYYRLSSHFSKTLQQPVRCYSSIFYMVSNSSSSASPLKYHPPFHLLIR